MRAGLIRMCVQGCGLSSKRGGGVESVRQLV